MKKSTNQELPVPDARILSAQEDANGPRQA